VGNDRLSQIGSAVAAEIAAGADLGPELPEATRPWEALLLGLRELGYNEGQNIVIERRWAGGRAERYHELAAELVAWKPDVIVAAFTPSVNAAKRATSTIPIVMAIAGDPVGTGLVASLARPGGNITGMSLQNSPELAGKRLQILTEAFPKVSRVGLLANRTLPHEISSGETSRAQRRRLASNLSRSKFVVPRTSRAALRARRRRPFKRWSCTPIL
jgi:putative tryptophan/tyrosine transport system substrate-binding protein